MGCSLNFPDRLHHAQPLLYIPKEASFALHLRAVIWTWCLLAVQPILFFRQCEPRSFHPFEPIEGRFGRRSFSHLRTIPGILPIEVGLFRQLLPCDFSPISTKRRMASGREGLGFCLAIHASIGSISAGALSQSLMFTSFSLRFRDKRRCPAGRFASVLRRDGRSYIWRQSPANYPSRNPSNSPKNGRDRSTQIQEQTTKRRVPSVYHGLSGTKRESLISKGFLHFEMVHAFIEDEARKSLE